MEKPPLYESFKLFGTSMKDQVKTAVQGKEWGWLTAYAVICLIALVVGISGVVTIVGNCISTWYKILPAPAVVDSMAPKTLNYNRLQKNEKVDGLYYNLFEVFVHNPGGNTDPIATVLLNLGQDAECSSGSQMEITEIGPGLASTTMRRLFECVTKDPMIDNGKLFDIVNNDYVPQ